MQVRPLSQRVTESMFQIAAEFEAALEEEIANHKNTLDLVRRLKTGEVSLDSVVITDNGWRVLPPEPSEETHDNGASPVAEPSRIG